MGNWPEYESGLQRRGDLNLYVSEDRGEHWRAVAQYLPPIYSVRFG